MKAALANLLQRLGERLDADVQVDTSRDQELRDEVQRIGDDWKRHSYYEQVEPEMDAVWNSLIGPFVGDVNFANVIDLAAGHGRNTKKLLEMSDRVWVTDINPENIEYCRRRFGADDRLRFFVGNGLTLTEVPDESITFVYCFDAMVHFDSDSIRSYLREFNRVLTPGGRGFCHHSNFDARPGGDLHQSPQWRNFMSKELFAHYCAKERLGVIRQQVVDWGPDPELDCLTLFERSLA